MNWNGLVRERQIESQRFYRKKIYGMVWNCVCCLVSPNQFEDKEKNFYCAVPTISTNYKHSLMIYALGELTCKSISLS